MWLPALNWSISLAARADIGSKSTTAKNKENETGLFFIQNSFQETYIYAVSLQFFLYSSAVKRAANKKSHTHLPWRGIDKIPDNV